jgi:hypothetical protein
MLKVKSCPRCNGDVVRGNDQYGWFEECLQCGHIYDVDTFKNSRRHIDDERRNRKRVHTLRKHGRLWA